MNDAKDRIHAPAVDNIIALGLAIYNNTKPGPESVSSDGTSTTLNKGKERETVQQMYERLLINTMEGKSPRGKVGGMKVVVGIREKSGALGLRPFMPLLAGYLEDGDSAVREGARTVRRGDVRLYGTDSAARLTIPLRVAEPDLPAFLAIDPTLR